MKIVVISFLVMFFFIESARRTSIFSISGLVNGRVVATCQERSQIAEFVLQFNIYWRTTESGKLVGRGSVNLLDICFTQPCRRIYIYKPGV